MYGNHVGWSDYSGMNGFPFFPGRGEGGEELAEMAKALQAGSDLTNPGTAPGVGFPLRAESLDETLRSTQFEMKEIVLFKDMPKKPAYQTVEQNNIIQDYGPDIPAFMAEGALPEEVDSTYKRQVDFIKYMGLVGRVTLQMSLVQAAHGDAVALEVRNKTMALLRQIEYSLFYGDSSLDPLQWDGYERKIRTLSPAANIIDLRGKTLSEDVLTDAVVNVRDEPNYGTITDCYLDPKFHGDLSKAFFPKARYDLTGGQAGRVTAGLTVQAFTSPVGPVSFQPDVFVDDDKAVPAAGIGDPSKRPSPPTISVGLVAAPAVGSRFIADDAGTYRYKIVAANQFGKSAPVTVVTGAPVTVAAGDGVTFSVDVGGIPATWYEVYRTKTNGALGTERLIQRVARTGSPQVITDLNARLPGTTKAFLFQMNDQAISLKQFAPMMKVPLAQIDLSIRWAQAFFATPILYAPGKICLIENIGRAPGSST